MNIPRVIPNLPGVEWSVLCSRGVAGVDKPGRRVLKGAAVGPIAGFGGELWGVAGCIVVQVRKASSCALAKAIVESILF